MLLVHDCEVYNSMKYENDPRTQPSPSPAFVQNAGQPNCKRKPNEYDSSIYPTKIGNNALRYQSPPPDLNQEENSFSKQSLMKHDSATQNNCFHYDQANCQLAFSPTIMTKETECSSFSRSRSSSESSFSRVNEEIREDSPPICEYHNNYSSMFVTPPPDDNCFWTEEMEDMLTLRRANPVFDIDDEEDGLPPNLHVEHESIEVMLQRELEECRSM